MEPDVKVAVMQPYIFPYIGYFQLIACADIFVIYDDVNFINKGWINRNNILLNGAAHRFTIPLEKASQNKLISEINVVAGWKNKWLKTIETAYLKAPHFPVIFPELEKWLRTEVTAIAAINRITIEAVCTFLGIKTKIVPSSSVYNNKELSGPKRILDICLKEKASMYINPIGGKELYETEPFDAKNIRLRFLRTTFTPYKQGKNEFVPGLSILDYLMFLSPAEIREKLTEFNLEEK
jgi:hypothetical protein